MKMRVFALLMAAITISCGKMEAHKYGDGLGFNGAVDSSVSCPNKLGGDWGQFGRVPYGCGLPQDYATALHTRNAGLVYNDAKKGPAEATRYTKAMYVVISNYAVAYIKRREPTVSAADVQGWLDLVLTMFHQESGWTQYRLGTDGIFRFFKGDGFRGYGMGQIDSRSHQKFIKSNQVYELGPHITYAFDMLYDMRKKAKASPCGGKSDVASINRSAWAAYNGGPGSKCRWTAASKWSQNDKGFWEKYQAQAWEKSMAGN